MRVLVAQIGARRHYAVPRALQGAGALDRLVTDACGDVPPWSWLRAAVPARWRGDGLKRLLGRSVRGVPRERISTLPGFALSGVWQAGNGETATERWARRNAAFCRAVVRKGFGDADTVYAFNGAALEIFEAAKWRGLRTVLDQTAAPWRWNSALLQQERERWPGWEDQPAEIDESGRLAEREEEEWALADCIVCGSEFAREALAEQGGPTERCVVVPYPSPVLESVRGSEPPAHGRAAGPLRVLFVGTLQLRKGVQYLYEASRLLDPGTAVFRLVGPSQLSARAMQQLAERMEIVGAVPRAEVAAHYAWADVFVLPTLSEGSANVVHEAMATGLPVITTPNAGVDMRDGVDGDLVPSRDVPAMVTALRRLIVARDLGPQFGAEGLCDSRGMGWQQYASGLRKAVQASP